MAPTALIGFFIVFDVYRLVSKSGQAKTSGKGAVEVFLPWNILLPVIAYVSLYSMLPHKELRFILPAVSAFNICTAYAVSRLWQLRVQFGSSSKNRWVKRCAEV
jgi:hypothetical protein